LHSYYQIYDFEHDAIGFNGDFVDFYPNRPKPIDNNNGGGGAFLIVLIVILAILAIVGIGFVVYKKR
jgi:hypothetical protein